jgi:hypothetical protein
MQLKIVWRMCAINRGLVSELVAKLTNANTGLFCIGTPHIILRWYKSCAYFVLYDKLLKGYKVKKLE